MTVLTSLFPIIFLLVAGYLLGKISPQKLLVLSGNSIGFLVWALLFFIGMEFGHIFQVPDIATKVITSASIYSLATLFFPSILILFFFRHEWKSNKDRKDKINLLEPIKEASIALLMVAVGASLSLLFPDFSRAAEHYNVSTWLLYALIFLVGADLVTMKIDSSWFSFKFLVIPFLVVVGSMMGAVVGKIILGDSLTTALALSSGFGWFTLSSVLVAEKLGAEYGATALMIDLFRELIAIVMMYLLGHRSSKMVIASGGATTMDSTLPIIKQTCKTSDVPLALISGFILSILAPILISFFLSFS